MKINTTPFVSVMAVVIVLTSFKYRNPAEEEASPIAYPEGYRQWTHVKTYIVGPKSPAFTFIGGFNHVYANEKAMQGYKTGHFPRGSVIVSDVIEAREDSVDIREGKRHHLDVMVRDSIKYANSYGWGFEQFSEDSQHRLLNPESMMVCANCHIKTKTFVIGKYRK